MPGDSDALRELLRVTKPGMPLVLLHYLYVKNKKVGARVAAQLQKLGFETEDNRSADGTSWLVLARHKVIPTDELIAQTRNQLEEIAASVDGEYDGWEADLEAP